MVGSCPIERRIKLLDLFCGAGGATEGLQAAGFYVVGVDINPQPHYCGDEFYKADALTFPLEGFDGYWASPPCQEYSKLKGLKTAKYGDLVEAIRIRLAATGKPYVIENVPGAPLLDPLMLCGSMFGLRVRRHRLFEVNPPIYFAPATCNHWGKCTGAGRASGRLKGKRSLTNGFAFVTVAGNDYLADEGRKAMGIDWMSKKELSQAVPPAYSEYLGKHLMAEVKARKMMVLC